MYVNYSTDLRLLLGHPVYAKLICRLENAINLKNNAMMQLKKVNLIYLIFIFAKARHLDKQLIIS